jgi:hypothetical protein
MKKIYRQVAPRGGKPRAVFAMKKGRSRAPAVESRRSFTENGTWTHGQARIQHQQHKAFDLNIPTTRSA